MDALPLPERLSISQIERLAYLVVGGGLLAYGLTKRGVGSLPVGAAGGYLLYHGAADRSAALPGVAAEPAAVRAAVTINRPRAELYRVWRELTNLPRFIEHLEAVTPLDERRSRWAAKAPAGARATWEAEITADEPGSLIAWRSLPGSEVDNRGEVRFADAPVGRGTEVRVTFRYEPPAGPVGQAVAKLFGEEPGQQAKDALRRFKQLMEAGEVATTEGQPSGRAKQTAGGEKPTDKYALSDQAQLPGQDPELIGAADADDVVLDASEDSFPASDPPSYARGSAEHLTDDADPSATQARNPSPS